MLRERRPCSRTISNTRRHEYYSSLAHRGCARLAVLRGQDGKLDVTEVRDQVIVNVAGVAGIGRRPNSWTSRVFQSADQELAFSAVITIVRQLVLEGWLPYRRGTRPQRRP